MNKNNQNSFICSIGLDELKNDQKNALRFSFPGINDSVIEKNLDFIELLNEYKGPGYRGLYDFLDKKGYDIVSINLNNGNNKPFNNDIINKIKSGEIFIGFKVFIENFGTDKQKFLTYNILAKKKNKLVFESFKNKVLDLLSGKNFSSENL